MIRAVQKQYQDGEAEQRRLHRLLEAEDLAGHRFKLIEAFRQNYSIALEQWPRLNRKEQRTMLEALITRVEAKTVGVGALHLQIFWFDRSSDSCTVATKGGKRGRYWLPAEDELLGEMIKRGATSLEIAAASPDRTWDAIGRRLKRFGTTYFDFPRPYNGGIRLGWQNFR